MDFTLTIFVIDSNEMVISSDDDVFIYDFVEFLVKKSFLIQTDSELLFTSLLVEISE
ncbi:hypothetical protein NDK25_12965 [Niallia taxi]|nr:hypothetical protein [Niallia taxi]MDE5053146.1 hypothetical protein [Niallia taxi]